MTLLKGLAMQYSVIRNAVRACQTSVEMAVKQRTITEHTTYMSCAKGHYMFVREEALKSREPLLLQMTWGLRRKLHLATTSWMRGNFQ